MFDSGNHNLQVLGRGWRLEGRHGSNDQPTRGSTKIRSTHRSMSAVTDTDQWQEELRILTSISAAICLVFLFGSMKNIEQLCSSLYQEFGRLPVPMELWSMLRTGPSGRGWALVAPWWWMRVSPPERCCRGKHSPKEESASAVMAGRWKLLEGDGNIDVDSRLGGRHSSRRQIGRASCRERVSR